MTNPVTEKLYPCDMCDQLRTKAEGGTTFTVCDECWEKTMSKTDPVREEMIPFTVRYHNAMGELERLTRLYPEQNEKVTEMLRRINEDFTSDLLRVIRGHMSWAIPGYQAVFIADAELIKSLESLPEEVKSGKSE